MANESKWPALPSSAWAGTRRMLHMYMQIVGKVRLGLAPFEPEWANVPLYLTARGLTTSPISYGERALQIDFDFIAHELQIKTSIGQTYLIPLIALRSVADFFEEMKRTLKALDVGVSIRPVPAEIPNPVPFTEDREQIPYDPEYAQRFWRILTLVHEVFTEHRAPFRGRHTPIQFFWGTFDLAYARYSGRSADPPMNADSIMRAAMDVEEVAAGFWAGDDRFPEPAFYCYGYPKPTGIERAVLRPEQAFWSDRMGELLLRYEDVRECASPRAAVRAFLSSTYEACSANWSERPLSFSCL